LGNEGLGGIARRWVKKSLEELTTTDNRTRDRAGAEQEAAEREFKDAAAGEALMTAIPGLRDLRDRQEASAAAAESRREAEHDAEIAARPFAGVGLQVAGAVEGSWSGQLPARVERVPASTPDADELEWNPFAGEASLRVDLTPPDHDVPLVGGQPLRTWTLVVPGYRGPGTYDLQAIAREREGTGGELDPYDHCLVLGHEDDPFHWYAEVPGSVDVADDERALVVRLTMGSAGGELTALASINLPA
jgi:hypothetical protein